jgi:leader peptidase (prepilin peptidase) / N-methyltransferase
MLGGSIASFTNVVIDRVPRRQSVVSPPSACPNCQHQLRAWENIPVLSWLIVHGRCHGCRSPIGVRTVVVEAAGAVIGAMSIALVTTYLWQ